MSVDVRSDDDADATGHRVEISGLLDRTAAEALRLEIRRLARRHGIALGTFRVERATEDGSA